MIAMRPERPRRRHSMRWPSTSFAHHSPSAGWNSRAAGARAPISAWIIAAADPSSAATADGGSGSAVTDDQLGNRHAGLELPHQLVGIEVHPDRVAIERGRVHPRLPFLGGREVVDLQLHAVATGIGVVHGRGGAVIDGAAPPDPPRLPLGVVA